jgi:hypothetical protein
VSRTDSFRFLTPFLLLKQAKFTAKPCRLSKFHGSMRWRRIDGQPIKERPMASCRRYLSDHVLQIP